MPVSKCLDSEVIRIGPITHLMVFQCEKIFPPPYWCGASNSTMAPNRYVNNTPNRYVNDAPNRYVNNAPNRNLNNILEAKERVLLESSKKGIRLTSKLKRHNWSARAPIPPHPPL